MPCLVIVANEIMVRCESALIGDAADVRCCAVLADAVSHAPSMCGCPTLPALRAYCSQNRKGTACVCTTGEPCTHPHKVQQLHPGVSADGLVVLLLQELAPASPTELCNSHSGAVTISGLLPTRSCNRLCGGSQTWCAGALLRMPSRRIGCLRQQPGQCSC